MKNADSGLFVVLACLLAYSSPVFGADTPVTAWGKQFSHALDEMRLAVDRRGNCFVAGTTSDSVSPSYAGKNDAYVERFDPAGNSRWNINVGSPEHDYVCSIVADRDGNCIVAGKTTGNLDSANLGGSDAFLIKIDTSGNILWKKQFGTSQNDALSVIVIDTAGDYYVAGSTGGNLAGTPAGGLDAFVAKFDANGTLLWQTQYGTAIDENGEYIALDKNNTCYVLLSSKKLLKYDNRGNFLGEFQHTIYSIKGIAVDDSLNIYIGGTTGVDYGASAIILKYDKNWHMKWQRTFNSGPWTGVNGMTKFQDGTDDILLGVCQNWPNCLAVGRRYDTQGNVKWIYSLQEETTKTTCGHNVAIDGDGNCYIVGLTKGNLFGPQTNPEDFFLAKFIVRSQTGMKGAKSIPCRLEIEQNYPNPFNPGTTIVYTLPRRSSVEITIFDLTGHAVRSMSFDSQSEGKQNLKWDGKSDAGNSVSSGVYIVRLRAASHGDGSMFDVSKKIVLLR